jgi:hypothetical protein
MIGAIGVVVVDDDDSWWAVGPWLVSSPIGKATPQTLNPNPPTTHQVGIDSIGKATRQDTEKLSRIIKEDVPRLRRQFARAIGDPAAL